MKGTFGAGRGLPQPVSLIQALRLFALRRGILTVRAVHLLSQFQAFRYLFFGTLDTPLRGIDVEREEMLARNESQSRGGNLEANSPPTRTSSVIVG